MRHEAGRQFLARVLGDESLDAVRSLIHGGNIALEDEGTLDLHVQLLLEAQAEIYVTDVKGEVLPVLEDVPGSGVSKDEADAVAVTLDLGEGGCGFFGPGL